MKIVLTCSSSAMWGTTVPEHEGLAVEASYEMFRGNLLAELRKVFDNVELECYVAVPGSDEGDSLYAEYDETRGEKLQKYDEDIILSMLDDVWEKKDWWVYA